MVSVLTTDFGPHPAEKWAQVTVDHLLPADSPTALANIRAHQRLRADFLDVLTKHHGDAQADEQKRLEGAGEAHFDNPHDGPTDVANLLGELTAAARGTPWEQHMDNEEFRAAIREVVRDHTHGIRHVERCWHADNNPHLEAGQAYRHRAGLGASPTAQK
jgi:hypothetical protein